MSKGNRDWMRKFLNAQQEKFAKHDALYTKVCQPLSEKSVDLKDKDGHPREPHITSS